MVRLGDDTMWKAEMPRTRPYFAVRLRNLGYEVSLEVRKLYEVVPDAGSEAHGLVRIIDESGEDYLYPADLFRRLDLPTALERELRVAS